MKILAGISLNFQINLGRTIRLSKLFLSHQHHGRSLHFSGFLFCPSVAFIIASIKNEAPLPCLAWLGASISAHAWVVGQVPSRWHLRGNHTLMFLSLFFSLALCLKMKSFKKMKHLLLNVSTFFLLLSKHYLF